MTALLYYRVKSLHGEELGLHLPTFRVQTKDAPITRLKGSDWIAQTPDIPTRLAERLMNPRLDCPYLSAQRVLCLLIEVDLVGEPFTHLSEEAIHRMAEATTRTLNREFDASNLVFCLAYPTDQGLSLGIGYFPALYNAFTDRYTLAASEILGGRRQMIYRVSNLLHALQREMPEANLQAPSTEEARAHPFAQSAEVFTQGGDSHD